MDLPIRNIDDLRAEIARLKETEREQSVAIGKRFNSLFSVFSTVASIFPKANPSEGTKGFFEQDIVSLLSRVILPFVLNKTVFRKSNFLIKALVGVLSQKASDFINEETISHLWGVVKGLFQHKKEEETPEHRAIPALSETY
ncbi:MAG TPA: hypothetical protein VFE53_04045 [Mucilaginibacter sp.]|jgi:hypothetical protein|nr:hypothetical protein [Mucilaginibacter sp.]